MKTCYNCGKQVKESGVIKEGVKLKCLKCFNCGEEFFSAGEMIRFDMLTGRRKIALN
ncbi:hypothetical protein HY837_06500 [archaeon]|nr:hypothetical protein [archaeon]